MSNTECHIHRETRIPISAESRRLSSRAIPNNREGVHRESAQVQMTQSQTIRVLKTEMSADGVERSSLQLRS